MLCSDPDSKHTHTHRARGFTLSLYVWGSSGGLKIKLARKITGKGVVTASGFDWVKIILQVSRIYLRGFAPTVREIRWRAQISGHVHALPVD